jgi:hypothetical protein
MNFFTKKVEGEKKLPDVANAQSDQNEHMRIQGRQKAKSGWRSELSKHHSAPKYLGSPSISGDLKRLWKSSVH